MSTVRVGEFQHKQAPEVAWLIIVREDERGWLGEAHSVKGRQSGAGILLPRTAWHLHHEEVGHVIPCPRCHAPMLVLEHACSRFTCGQGDDCPKWRGGCWNCMWPTPTWEIKARKATPEHDLGDGMVGWDMGEMEAVARRMGLDVNEPWGELPHPWNERKATYSGRML